MVSYILLMKLKMEENSHHRILDCDPKVHYFALITL